jgi:hypothetical protein
VVGLPTLHVPLFVQVLCRVKLVFAADAPAGAAVIAVVIVGQVAVASAGLTLFDFFQRLGG